ncbi:hypothetical protein [Actinopolymorpha alba]|uniref:hypothetical protein n=1 Tax=Actinopolymorpha alba TaxID=533267 RepID=UPI0003630BE9|nr:hypothetical protein [Actinopolymorpha alba]
MARRIPAEHGQRHRLSARRARDKFGAYIEERALAYLQWAEQPAWRQWFRRSDFWMFVSGIVSTVAAVSSVLLQILGWE